MCNRGSAVLDQLVQVQAYPLDSKDMRNVSVELCGVFCICLQGALGEANPELVIDTRKICNDLK